MRLCTGKEFAVFGGPLPADRTDPSDPSDQSDSLRAASEAARPRSQAKGRGQSACLWRKTGDGNGHVISSTEKWPEGARKMRVRGRGGGGEKT